MGEYTNLCEACSSLQLKRSDLDCSSWPDRGTGLVGTIANLRQQQHRCGLCRLILEAIRRQIPRSSSGAETDGETRWSLSWETFDIQYNFGKGVPALSVYVSGSCQDHSIRLVDGPDTQIPLCSRIVPEDIDMTLIRGWLAQCIAKHGPRCVEEKLGWAVPAHPQEELDFFLVIDVMSKCLVELPSNEAYVALSYVWGQENLPRTFVSNVAVFMEEGAFTKKILPKTISDAIEVTAALDFRYLWVDSLCIIQDSAVKTKMINNMHLVYRHACLTIVAASGDVNFGLSGWSNMQERRSLIKVETISPDIQLGLYPRFDSVLNHTEYSRRAWTLQETALSSRCLVFLDGLVYFSCRLAIWREDVNAEPYPEAVYISGPNALARVNSQSPTIAYQTCIQELTKRSMTHESDALYAFMGIQRVMSDSMNNTRFWYGLPASIFDLALLWDATCGRVLKRRPEFPSWSWSGWIGGVGMQYTFNPESIQRWMLQRTWIDWYISDETGSRGLIWDPDRDNTGILPLFISVTEDDWLTVRLTSDKTEESLNSVCEDCQTENDSNRESTGDDESQESGLHPTENEGKEEEDNTAQQDLNEEEEERDRRDFWKRAPQYANPTKDSLYGRLHPFNLPSSIPPKPTSASPTVETSLQPGTLIFTTVTTTYQILSSRSFLFSGEENFFLFGNDDQPYGFILDRVHSKSRVFDENRSGMAQVEVILLSFAGSDNLDGVMQFCQPVRDWYRSVMQSEGGKPGEHEPPAWPKTWEESGLFNVMFVAPKRSYPCTSKETDGGADSSAESGEKEVETEPVIYERLGLGLLHWSGVAKSFPPGPCWKEIFLY